MKKSIATIMSRLVFLFFVLMSATIAFAQDGGGSGSSEGGSAVTVSKSSTSTSTTTAQDWYTAPWVWVVGGAVFLLLLIALVRGGGSSRTDVHKTTVRKDVTSTD